MTLADRLREISIRTPPSPEYGGLVISGTGAPDSATSPFFVFYIDSLTDSIYYNPDRAANGFKLLIDGSLLTSDQQQVLTATI